jgi:hypothetical protein
MPMEPPPPAPRWTADDIFEGGPPRRLTALVHLPAPVFPNVVARALAAAIIGWLPLLLLTLVAPPRDVRMDLLAFADDVGAHGRFLFAVPLLVIAYGACARRLGQIVWHFEVSNLLGEQDKALLAKEVDRARQLINAPLAEAAAAILAYGIVITFLSATVPQPGMAEWLKKPDGLTPSLAGWWHFLVSLPLLLLILFGWFWRIFVWTRLLSKIARMDLRLIAAHPDRAGGLGFMTQSVRAFTIVAAGLGCITAGRFANVHLSGLDTRFTDGLLIGGTVVLTFGLCVGPLLVFSAPLMRAWRHGAMTYGTLANILGEKFERRWFDGTAEDNLEILSEPDFSAATDLYQVVANVYTMRFMPIESTSLILLLLASLLPFLPAMLLSMPFETVLAEFKGLIM